jgi:hypothetical protein
MNNNEVATKKRIEASPSALAENAGDGSSKISGSEVKVGDSG